LVDNYLIETIVALSTFEQGRIYPSLDLSPTAKSCLDAGCGSFVKALTTILGEYSDGKMNNSSTTTCGNPNCHVVIRVLQCDKTGLITVCVDSVREQEPACLKA